MKNFHIFFTLIFISTQINVFAQNINNTDNFNYLVRKEEGDLNKDGKKDRVVVHMDTTDETRPLRLQIHLSQPIGKLALVVSSTQIIEAQYPAEKQGEHNGYQIPDFRIEKGTLLMWSEIKGGRNTDLLFLETIN